MTHNQHHGNRDQQVQDGHDAGRGQRHPLRAGTNQVDPSGTQRPFTRSQVSQSVPFVLMTPYKSGAGIIPAPFPGQMALGNGRHLARVLLRLARGTLAGLVRGRLVRHERA